MKIVPSSCIPRSVPPHASVGCSPLAERPSTWITRRRFVLLGGAAFLAACERQLSRPSSTTSLTATTRPTPSTTSPSTTTTTAPPITTSSAPPETTASTQPSGSALANPSAMGYPDATNTGVPEGTSLLDLEGTLEVWDAEIMMNGEVVASRPGSGSVEWGPVTLHPGRTDIDGAEIVGRLQQRSTLPVFVSNSSFSATAEVTDAFYQVHTAGAPTPRAKVYLADCTIWAGHGKAAAFGGWMEFLRCDISGGEDAIDLQTEIHLRDCYIHDLERREGSHNDVLQSGGAVNASVVHCTLLAAMKATPNEGMEFPDGWYDPMNAVLMIGNYGGEVRNVTVEDCLVDGGNYTINDNWYGDHPVRNIVVRRNRFGRHFRYGPKSLHGSAWVWEENVWDDTGESV